MLVDHSLAILYILAFFFAILYIYSHAASPLRSIQGPFLARFSRLWYFSAVSSGRFETINASLHAKYGKIVRLAPNQYSISDPSAIQTIYKTRHGETPFRKSDFYSAWQAPNKPNIFTERDPVAHTRDRKKFHAAYTMSTMTTYEKYVDDCVEILCRRMEEVQQSGKEVDMSWWLQCFAFDVIGEISFSKRFGFLDRGEDQSGLIENVHRTTKYSVLMGMFPEWHVFYFNTLQLLGKLGFGKGAGKQYLRDFTFRSMGERQKKVKKERDVTTTAEDDNYMPKDFMTKFIEQHQRDPTHFTLDDTINGVLGNINAGSDTTGVALSAIMYYLLASPRVLQRLRDELSQQQVSDPTTFKEVQSLEYLQAVIKEAMRLHPSIGVQLPRVVPKGGAIITGQFFPGETIVGLNPYVLHHDKDVFGGDADAFRPERWLRSECDAATLARMENTWCPFGAGSRTCIGKNVSLLEMSKLVPQLVRRFDFEMSDGLEREGLKTYNEFFIQIRNLRLKVVKRRLEV
ncbi:hypothetical protein M409DRAFT_22224 [Zasmidium cellare ATCC 36951]|uniref:Cytochrome P450 n=1 Tax=Zasmidium cellare ATCC 36951 TaxID=1080233 RepID=A0A6A6CJJ8_ZASCE|nr:uncharacterized protein M409DRAFT_22224 [Zasmidium cellare ATCC 36951]KAF2167414.1 hypothetical protein M409DRAFT_22224 [Zasmidium cellare ATCC 36951]